MGFRNKFITSSCKRNSWKRKQLNQEPQSSQSSTQQTQSDKQHEEETANTSHTQIAFKNETENLKGISIYRESPSVYPQL